MPLFGNKTNGTRAQIFSLDGGRMSDPDIQEDRQANALVSNVHRIAIPLRRPTNIFRHTRNGLSPTKGRSIHLINRAPKAPDLDLRFLLHLEGVFYAALSGESPEEDLEAKRMSRLAYIFMCVSGIGFLAALFYRLTGSGIFAAPEEAAGAAAALTHALRLAGV